MRVLKKLKKMLDMTNYPMIWIMGIVLEPWW